MIRTATLAALLTLAAVPAFAQVTAAEVRTAADGVNADVVAWRRHLHQNPELGLAEVQTAAFVAEVDLVVDCCDNLASRHAINAVCVAQHKPWISAATHIASRNASRSTRLTSWLILPTVHVPAGSRARSRKGRRAGASRAITASSVSPRALSASSTLASSEKS
jgi:hypothetical protein